MGFTDTQLSRVDDSNFLRNLGRPLSKVPDPAPTLPPLSAVPGRVGAYAEVTRAHRSVALSDAGEQFSQSRFASETYPIQGPLCDMRDINQVFGLPSRYIGRDPVVRETK